MGRGESGYGGVIADRSVVRGRRRRVQGAELGGGDRTDGVDYWAGSGQINQGTVTFSQDALWSDLRAGTIITIAEQYSIRDGGGLVVTSGSDTSYDPAAGDWWIHVCTFANSTMTLPNTQLATAATNIASDRPGSFKVGKADWVMRIIDNNGAEIHATTGEGAPSWKGAGISNEEGGALLGPGAGATAETWMAIGASSSLYDETIGTSFSEPNVSFSTVTGRFTTLQDFTDLRRIGSQGGAATPPRIFGIAREGDDLVLQWASAPGERFEIEVSTGLDDWETVPESSATATGDSTSARLPIYSDSACYRVRRLP